MKKPKNNGILLLEMLMTLAILVGGILVVFQSFKTAVRAMGQSKDYFSYTLLLERKTIEVEEQRRFPSEMEEESSSTIVIELVDLPAGRGKTERKKILLKNSENGEPPLLETVVFLTPKEPGDGKRS